MARVAGVSAKSAAPAGLYVLVDFRSAGISLTWHVCKEQGTRTSLERTERAQRGRDAAQLNPARAFTAAAVQCGPREPRCSGACAHMRSSRSLKACFLLRGTEDWQGSDTALAMPTFTITITVNPIRQESMAACPASTQS